MSTWRTTLLRPSFLVSLLVLGGSAAGLSAALAALDMYLMKLPIHAPGNRAVHAVPAETVGWVRVGTDGQESAATLEELGTANYLNRRYVAKEKPAGWAEPPVVDVHLAYYTGMIETVPHVPERCMVGGGWEIIEGSATVPVPLSRETWLEDREVPAELAGKVFTARLAADPSYTDAPGARIRLPLDPDRVRLRVTRFSNPATGQSLYAGYFFIANGATVPSADEVRLLAFNLNEQYAYYLKVQFTSMQVESPEGLGAVAGLLLDDLLPEIMRCVPDWVEVQAGRYPPDNPRRLAAGGADDAARNSSKD